jgi:hypothetical protein
MNEVRMSRYFRLLTLWLLKEQCACRAGRKYSRRYRMYLKLCPLFGM